MTDYQPPDVLKKRFAKNVDGLLRNARLSRKAAAQKIGVSYRLMRRWVSSGVSRSDPRNIESLRKLIRYFKLGSVEELWTNDFSFREATPLPKLLEVEAANVAANEVKITLSNGIELSISPNRDSLYLHFSCLGRDGTIAVSPTGRDDDPQKLDLSNFVHVHLPHKDHG